MSVNLYRVLKTDRFLTRCGAVMRMERKTPSYAFMICVRPATNCMSSGCLKMGNHGYFTNSTGAFNDENASFHLNIVKKLKP